MPNFNTQVRKAESNVYYRDEVKTLNPEELAYRQGNVSLHLRSEKHHYPNTLSVREGDHLLRLELQPKAIIVKQDSLKLLDEAEFSNKSVTSDELLAALDQAALKKWYGTENLPAVTIRDALQKALRGVY